MLAACMSLVALQISGLHIHVNAQGFSGTPQGAHVHDTHSRGTAVQEDNAPAIHEHVGGQGHTGDQDVSIVKATPTASKMLLDLIALAFILLMVLRPADKIAPCTAVTRPGGHHERWRPPLRAPPHPSLIPSH